jgi:hypothetical protein
MANLERRLCKLEGLKSAGRMVEVVIYRDVLDRNEAGQWAVTESIERGKAVIALPDNGRGAQ